MNNDVHQWFGLSYASYFVLPRSVLQSMPSGWQKQFVELLEKLEDRCWESMINESYDHYIVQAKDNKGKFIRDNLASYDHGRRDVFMEKTEKRAKETIGSWPKWKQDFLTELFR